MKFKMVILFFAIIICISGLHLYTNGEKFKLYKYVNNEDYEIRYTYKPSLQYYSELEIIIYANGKFVSNRYMLSGAVERIQGYYDSMELKKFTKFAIRKNIINMTDDMNAVDIYDGHSIFYEFKFGSKYLLVGGYMAEHINNSFKKINERFQELDYEVINN
jgi:phage pi2 protein 07